jgi:hypothetical protein
MPFNFCFLLGILQASDSQDSSVDVTTGYGLDGRGSIPGKVRHLFLLLMFQTGDEAQPTSNTLDTGRYFPGRKAVGA